MRGVLFWSVLYVFPIFTFGQNNSIDSIADLPDSLSDVGAVIDSSFNIKEIPELLDVLSEYVTDQRPDNGTNNAIHDVFFWLFVSIGVYVVIIFLVPTSTWINNAIRKRNLRSIRNTKSKYKEVIFEFLCSSDPDATLTLHTKRSNVNKSILLRIIYELALYISSNEKEKLIRIYKHYELEKHILQKLKSPLAYRSYYLKTLSVLGPSPRAIYHLKKLSSYPKRDVRLYAIECLIAQDTDWIEKIFSDYKFKLSLWEQINYYDFFVSQDIKIPDFHSLSLNKNDTVAMFAIRMVRMFKQKRGSLDGYESLLTHPNVWVQAEMFKTLAELEYPNLNILLSELMTKTNIYIRQHIISYLAKMKYATSSILMQYYNDNPSAELRLHILYCIYNFVENGKQDIEVFAGQDSDPELKKLSIHLLKNVL